MQKKLGTLLLFEGDFRKVNITFPNITSFTSVSAVLKNGDQDVTSTYINSTITSVGNMVNTDNIGEKLSIPPGNYRYYVTGVHDGKTETWYLDVPVLPKDVSLLNEIPVGDYPPLIQELVAYEGDVLARSLTIPDAEFSAVTGIMTQDADTTPTTTYCSNSANYSGPTLTSHSIGGQASIPQGVYGYFFTGTYNNGESKTTWFYKLRFLPKQSMI